MGVVIAALLLFFCIVFWSGRFRGTFISLFSTLWLLVFLFYESGYNNLYSVKTSTYLMYFFGLMSFYIAYIIGAIIPKKNKTGWAGHKPLNYRWLLIVLSLLSIVVLALKAVRAIPLWLLGGEGDLKTALITEDILSLGFLGDGIYQYVARPMQIVLLIYAVELLVVKKKDILLVILAILTSFLYFVASAAKFSILAFIVLFLAYFIYYRRKGFLAYVKSHKSTVFLLLIVVIVIYNLMSFSSGGHIFDSIFVYICGCIPCSDIALESLNASSYSYGAVTFNGLLTFLKFPCEILGILPDIRDFATEYFEKMMRFEESVYISSDIQYNAFISMFSYFYADGGYIGVIFLSSFWGYVCQGINYRAFHNPSYRDVAFLLFITVVIVDTLVRFPLFFVTYFMDLLYIMFFFPNNRVTIKE